MFKYLKQLTNKGFAVLRVMQLEDSESKKIRLANDDNESSTTKRTLLPLETAAFQQDGSIAVVHGDTCVVYFVDENTYVETKDRLMETLMQFHPTEIICADDSLCRSMRTLFPKSVLRTSVPHGFTPLHTLRAFLGYLARGVDASKLRLRPEAHTHPMKIDARTIQNLTLFESEYVDGSLFKALNKCKTKKGAELFRTQLFSPIQNIDILQKRNAHLQSCISNPYLSTIYDQMPNILTLYNHQHVLFRQAQRVVQTSASINKWYTTINAAMQEIRLWNSWGALVQTLGLQWTVIPSPPELLIAKDLPFDTTALETYRSKQVVPCTYGKGRFKYLLETSAQNLSTVRSACSDAVLVTQSKKLIRYDTRKLQSLRLQWSEAEILHVIHQANIIEHWLVEFQRCLNTSCFQQCALLDAIVSGAFFFHTCQEQWCWPSFDTDKVCALNITLPIQMVGGYAVVANSIKTQQAVLYGHNGSGKSTYMKAVGINMLLAHCGLPVFAKSFQTPVRDALFLRFGSNDSLAEGKSSFDVEMEHVHSILTVATKQTAVFCDELGCSCDAPSGVKICHWFLKQFKELQCFLVFATHFDIDMDIGLAFKEMDHGFKIQDTVDSRSRNAITLAEECGFPASILYLAESILSQADH